jgi:hypothetical protein
MEYAALVEEISRNPYNKGLYDKLLSFLEDNDDIEDRDNILTSWKQLYCNRFNPSLEFWTSWLNEVIISQRESNNKFEKVKYTWVYVVHC